MNKQLITIDPDILGGAAMFSTARDMVVAVLEEARVAVVATPHGYSTMAARSEH